MSAATFAEPASSCKLQAAGCRLPAAAKDGLTLIEVLIAMAILVTIGAAGALMFQGITRAWRTGELRTEQYQQARLLFDLLTREVTSSVADVRYPLIGEAETLFFVGTLPGRTGLVERRYWLGSEGELMCHDGEPADGDPNTGTSEICGREISQFAVSYFDGSTWLTEWDGRSGAPHAGALPRAVHITLMIGRQRPEQFDTVIHVPTS